MFTFGMTAEAQSSCTHNASSQGEIDSFISNAQPGQTLCIADGTYSRIILDSTVNGTASQPISVRALHDGGVLFRGDWPVRMGGSYVVLEGVNVEATGGEWGASLGGDHNTMRRVIIWTAPGADASVFGMGGTNGLIEDCAVFGAGRKVFNVGAISGNQDLHNTVRRCWAEWSSLGSAGGGPRNAMEIGYFQSYVTAENVLATGVDGGGEGPIYFNHGHNNRLFGSIAYTSASGLNGGAYMIGSQSDSQYGDTLHDTFMQDVVAIVSPQHPRFGAIRPFSLNQEHGGIWGYNNTFTNVVGVGGQPSTCNWGSACSTLRQGTSLSAAIGQGKSIFQEVPGICHRYINGELTNQPLWPWPMNQRIKDALRQSGRAEVDITATMESLLGPIPAECKGSGTSTPSPTPTPVLPPGSLCSKIDQAYSLPTGFGSPYNFFLSPISRTLEAYCDYSNVTNPIVNAFVSKPSAIQYHYTYTTGYQWNSTASQWEPFTFTCDQALVVNLWCTGNAKKQLNYAQPYFIAYACSWMNSQWKCGCRDSQCTQGFWQLQKFQ
jgi:hypothetical protein